MARALLRPVSARLRARAAPRDNHHFFPRTVLRGRGLGAPRDDEGEAAIGRGRCCGPLRIGLQPLGVAEVLNFFFVKKKKLIKKKTLKKSRVRSRAIGNDELRLRHPAA